MADTHITHIISSTPHTALEVESSIMRGWSQPEAGYITCSGSHGSSQCMPTPPMRRVVLLPRGMAHPEEPVPCSHGDSGQGRAATLGEEVRSTHATRWAPQGRIQSRVSMHRLLGQMPLCLTLLS